MQVFTTVNGIRGFVRSARAGGKVIGFVPTMGCLHQGHLSLVKRAMEECGAVVVSIFVNPLQFGANEDLDRYPRDFERDSELLRKCGADALFFPSPEEMYPPGFSTGVEVTGLTECLCGGSRPGHFRGVTTVVAKLFNVVQPDKAYFGQKDAQQALVIRKMVLDLLMPVEVVTLPTVREADGLAMSSRNIYLSPAQRTAATVLYSSLEAAAGAVDAGEKDAGKIEQMVSDAIARAGAEIDYVEVRSWPGLEKVESLGSNVLLALAARFGGTRLIDNIVINNPGLLSPLK